ncbi:MAG TPA: hypothetical protein VJT82_08880, partial [Pyrinomonadaceae bacterium]|nr:hypothetical protein [Pyrinomonadaceae bacterium]
MMDSETSEPIAPTPPAALRRDALAESTQRTAAASTLPDRPLILIESEESGVQLALSDLWSYRELLYFLTWRDIK